MVILQDCQLILLKSNGFFDRHERKTCIPVLSSCDWRVGPTRVLDGAQQAGPSCKVWKLWKDLISNDFSDVLMTVVYIFFDLESLISCSYIDVKMHLQILCISRLPVDETISLQESTYLPVWYLLFLGKVTWNHWAWVKTANTYRWIKDYRPRKWSTEGCIAKSFNMICSMNESSLFALDWRIVGVFTWTAPSYTSRYCSMCLIKSNNKVNRKPH